MIRVVVFLAWALSTLLSSACDPLDRVVAANGLGEDVRLHRDGSNMTIECRAGMSTTWLVRPGIGEALQYEVIGSSGNQLGYLIITKKELERKFVKEINASVIPIGIGTLRK